MKGYVQDVAALAAANHDFRRVLYTAAHCQLVVMSLGPSEEIGEEVHDVDQFLRVESGSGSVLIDGARTLVRAGSAIVVPAGARHNVTSDDSGRMQLYTLYAPPHHRDGVVHRRRADAEADSEHFDGRTTEGRSPAGASG